VTRALPAGTVLVDYLIYHHHHQKAAKGRAHWEKRLLAFVLRHRAKPVVRSLGPLAEIEPSLFASLKAIEAAAPTNIGFKEAAHLREKLWTPLEDHLGRPKTVLVSPDGVLALFPFAALPGTRKGMWLVEEVAIGQVTSGRQVLDFAVAAAGSANAEGLLALGGLDYGKPGRPLSVEALPGTRHEADQVVEVYRKRFPRGVSRKLGVNTTSADLLAALARSPGKPSWRYLHLATHAFFATYELQRIRLDANDSLLSLVRNPLLLSGLILGGHNTDAEKGTLTAEEVSSLDLRGVDLAVLSACETGLGKITSGEGVLGLQRAFHVAGVRTTVASLWSVSDPATSVLMEEMYKRLWGAKKLSRLEALRQAQLFVLNNPKTVLARAKELQAKMPGVALRGVGKKAMPIPADGKGTYRSPPAWWAAFVLSGDPG
jgi:CHAT domain-containing protein